MRKLCVAVIRFYQLTISRFLPPVCRYNPSCSEYTRQAVERFGVIKGLWLGLLRILRCAPWGRGGEDPVPQEWRK